MTDLSPMAEEAEYFFNSLPEQLRRIIGGKDWRDLHPFVQTDIEEALYATYDYPQRRCPTKSEATT